MASETLPQLNVADFQPQIIWLLIIFSVFYAVVKSKLAPYFRLETENREHYISSHHQDARKLQKKAEYLADEYNEKVRSIHARANDLIMEAKKKNHNYLESEKNRLNEDMIKNLQGHYDTLQQEVKHVDKEFLNHMDGLKKQAYQKISQIDTAPTNDNLQLHKN
jgi:F-type H+-transporting ATPase subunit b